MTVAPFATTRRWVIPAPCNAVVHRDRAVKATGRELHDEIRTGLGGRL